ncbi:MAG: EamA family transporter [Alphaproteobacteria bacterium]|nr:EamA family transporter [Alphaproteobacteria bacterium]
MRPVDLAIALFVVTIWGLNFVFVKIGVAEIPPFLFMALRFGVVAVILVPFIKWPHGRGKALLAYSLMLGVIHFGLMFNAIHLIDASTVALLSQLNTPFAVILSAILFRDYPGWKRVLGISIAFAGCFVIAGEPRFDGALLPILMVVGGTFAWAVAAVQAKKMGSIGPFALNGWMALFSTPPLLAISLMTESGQWEALRMISIDAVISVLYQSVLVVIVGYGLWYGLINRYALSRVIPFTLLLPVIGVAGGVLALGEALTVDMLIGGGLIIVGVGIVALRQAARGEMPPIKPH